MILWHIAPLPIPNHTLRKASSCLWCILSTVLSLCLPNSRPSPSLMQPLTSCVYSPSSEAYWKNRAWNLKFSLNLLYSHQKYTKSDMVAHICNLNIQEGLSWQIVSLIESWWPCLKMKRTENKQDGDVTQCKDPVFDPQYWKKVFFKVHVTRSESQWCVTQLI